MFSDEALSTIKTLRSIRNTLKYDLKKKYNIEDDKKIDSLLKIHGLHKDNFDFIKNIEKNINEQIHISIDDNANKSEKTVEATYSSLIDPIRKSIGYSYLYNQLKKDFGKQEAKRLTGEMFDFSLVISDSTKILSVYCWAFDASKLVINGRDFGVLHSKPPKRLSSYISSLCETIHQMSNHQAGALAIGSFFLDSAQILMLKQNYTLEQIKTDGKLRKEIENEFQQFVHSVNHLSRNSSESPFTNISIFDRPKLKSLLSEENYAWYFENKDLDEVLEVILELQKIFLDFFDKGDPTKEGLLYRFPVVTINLSKKQNEKNEWYIEDTKFLEEITKYDIVRYNIFTSEGTKVASCCRMINNQELMKDFSGQSNSFGGVGMSLGSHRVMTINFNRIALESDSKEKYISIFKNRIEDAVKILSSHKKLINFLTEKGLQPFIKNGFIDMNRMFSTIGVIGIVEAERTMKQKNLIKQDEDFMAELLIILNEEVKKMYAKYNIIINIEQIPGESVSIRTCDSDKIIFGNENVNYMLYANQFTPLWEDSSIWDKMEQDGKYNHLLNGGSINHIQVGENITKTQAKKIIEFAVKSDCQHFAINPVFNECKNGHITKGKVEKCAKCGENIVGNFTRVIGFFTRVQDWTKVRKEWEFPRRKFIKVDVN